jgi:predicted flap endonuclease-1-like 5' DNA nuclease
MSPLSQLAILALIILVVWYLMTRAARTYKFDIQPHHAEHDAHAAEVKAPAQFELVKEPVEARRVMAAELAPPAAAAGAAPAVADDLTRLEGIGPKVNSLLQDAGITTFRQLAEADPSRLRQILDAAGLKFIDPGSWAEQARFAGAGDWEGLEKLTDALRGGRRVD